MVDDILEIAAAKGLKVKAVIETHDHADHISGHGELSRRTGAEIYVHEQADVKDPHKSLKDGDELQFGVARLRVIHTPGHRPEHISLAISDTSRSDEPWLVLTGDSLFIGDIARPDLAVPGEEGASVLYDSIFNRLLKLDDGVEVYPAHVAGSLCGRGMSSKYSSTIGFERKHNTAAVPRSRMEFIRDMNDNLPQRPPNMYNIIERNRDDFAHVESPLYPKPLDAHTFQREIENGALVIDTRSPRAFGEGHIPGSIHVYLRSSSFATRVGFVVSPENRLLLVLKNEGELHTAINQLSIVGFDQVVGYLDGGMSTWQEAGLPIQQLSQIAVETLHSMRHDLKILDVRDKSEWEEGHIKGATHITYYFLVQRLQELDNTQPLAPICASGQRSSIDCSLLQKNGFTQLFNVVGGMDAWDEAGLEIE